VGKFILVPPQGEAPNMPQTRVRERFTVQQQFDYNNSKCFTPSWVDVMLPNVVQWHPPVDPLDTILAWNAKPGQEKQEKDSREARTISIAFYEVEFKCWLKTEISDWIEAHCQENVYVQMFTTYGCASWSFVFVSQEDHDVFKSWWDLKLIGGWGVTIPLLTPDHDAKMRAWAEENIKGDRRFERWLTSIRAIFRDEADYMFFALRWLHDRETAADAQKG